MDCECLVLNKRPKKPEGKDEFGASFSSHKSHIVESYWYVVPIFLGLESATVLSTRTRRPRWLRETPNQQQHDSNEQGPQSRHHDSASRIHFVHLDLHRVRFVCIAQKCKKTVAGVGVGMPLAQRMFQELIE